jgi:hypothetical protein
MAERETVASSGDQFCGNCGAVAVPGSATCGQCGLAVQPEDDPFKDLQEAYVPYCRACGVPVPREAALHCTKCGVTPLCREHFYPSTRSCSLCPPEPSAEIVEQAPPQVGSRFSAPWAQAPAAVPCPECGARIRQGVEFCPNCGSKQESYSAGRYAGFLPRLGAFVIDNLITGVPVALFAIFIDIPALGTVISIVYYVLFTYYQGQTPGKMLLGLHVQDENGNKPTLKQVLLREVVGKIISTVILLIGYLWILWDPKKRGWHDYIARTYVIKK